jgi:hypothetical protein
VTNALAIAKKTKIIVRCYLDEFTEILKSVGGNEVISRSKSALPEFPRTSIWPARRDRAR